MATITSAQTGLASATTTWVGGIVPVLGDKVVIAAGHVVTLDSSRHWGDDTSTGITITGTLRASRTVSTTLTCRGDLFVAQGGTLDWGTEADPVPAGVTAAIVINESAVMGHAKWGIRTDSGSPGWLGFRMWGAYKRPFTFLSAPLLASGTVLSVQDATGWIVGDLVGVAPTNTINPTYRQITAITPTAGSSAEVTISASVGRDVAAGYGVLNLTRNVTVIGHLPQTWRTHVALRVQGTVTDRIEMGPCTITACGNNGVGGNFLGAGLNIYYEQTNLTTPVVQKIDGPVITSLISVAGSADTHVSATAQRNGFNVFNIQAVTAEVKAIYVALPGSSGTSVYMQSGSSVDFGPECLLLGGGNSLQTQNGPGAVDCKYRGRVWGANSVVTGNAISFSLLGAIVGAHYRFSSLSVAGSFRAVDCTLSGPEGGPVAVNQSLGNNFGVLAPTTIVNSTVGTSFGTRRIDAMDRGHPSHTVDILQRDGDPTANERYTRGGRVHRDGTRTRRSTGSIALASWYSANVLSMPLSAKVAPGGTLRLRGAVWIEASYLPGDAPAITLSATGLAPINWSAPAVAEQWHEFGLEMVNTNSYPTDVAITLAARSNANSETARVWFDGIFADPWSGSVRHHGYQWLAQTSLRLDTRITLTEAAALALPVAVDHTAQTITVTGALTARQVFEACMVDLVQPDNQVRDVHINSATGDSFETSYTVVTSGSGVIVGAYEDASGRRVTIQAPALIAGSRVQVYDLTASAELFNGVLPGAGLLLPVTWTADHTVRLRAEHATKLPLETVGVLASSGLTFLDVQSDDTVYASNAIDGATCTEFVADGANVQVDISDPDGVTSVQRLYAWAQWYQTTAEGIASEFYGAIEAIDAATYQIDQTKADIHLDNVQALPVRVVGGYLARRDGSTVIAATSNSIQMDPGKAYVAGVDGLARESTVQAALAVSLG